MKRNHIYTIAISCIVFAVYSVVVFLFGEYRGASFWVTYVCTLFSVAMVEVSHLQLAAKGRKHVSFLNIPLVVYSVGFVAVQIILGVVLALFVKNLKAVILIEVFVYAVFMITYLSTMLGRDAVDTLERKLNMQTQFISAFQVKVDNLCEVVTDRELKLQMKKLQETVRYSDPVSAPELREIEAKIDVTFERLEERVRSVSADGSKEIQELTLLLKERNRCCRAVK